jgi:FtsZ-binding cell division protein ZapB
MKNRITKQIYLFLYLLIKQTINRIMNLREKVNALFAKHNVSLTAEETVVDVKQMVEAILADGTSIYSDSDTWAPGVRVLSKDADGNEVVVADGEYTTAEGVIVVVADGLLVELKPMVEEPEVEVEVEAEKQSTDESLNAEVEGLLSLVAKLESELSEAKKANENLSSEVTKLSAQPAVQSIKEVKQAKVSAPSKSYNKMSAEERFLFHLNK